MQRSLLFAFVLLLALVAAGLWWFAQDPTAAVLPGSPSQAEDNHPAAAQDVETATSELQTVTGERSAAEARIAAKVDATGRSLLRVAARWADATPAADVLITLRGASRAQAYAVFGRVRSNSSGVATFVEVPAGKWSLRSDRGDREEIDVTGGVQDVVFELEGGVAVDGLVVDARQAPVGGASVWLQTRDPLWSGGSVLATTGADGRFALERVPPHVSLGAFAKGHTPSDLVDLDVVDTKSSPVTVTLTLHDHGGQLEGVVVDLDDAPIVGALVAIGKESDNLDIRGERVIERWSVRSTETDEHGRFGLVGLAPGDAPITVRAKGCGFWRSSCAIIDGETTEVTVRMAQSGTVRGIVRGPDEAPIAGALLRCYDREPRVPFIAGGQIDFDETLGYLATTAAADGSFTLADVSAGTAFVFAQPGGRPKWGEPVPYASAQLEMPAGGTIEWDPVLSDGRAIEGVVYYRDGHPMGDVFVTLIDERSQKRHVQTNNTNGVFRFVNLDPSIYTASVQYWDAPKGTPALQQAGIEPDRGRIELRAPFDKPVKLATGSVLGRVDDVGGRIQNPKAARVALMSDKGWFHDNGELVDGAFRFERVDPCRFRLALMEEEAALAYSDWFVLQPGAALDTGVLRTEPGSAVHLTVTRAAGAEQCAPKLYFQREGAPRSTVADLGHAHELLVPGLTPGIYSINGYASGMVAIEAGITVTAGATAELKLHLEAGRLYRFEIWLPPEQAATTYHYVITGADGRVFLERSREFGRTTTRPFPLLVMMPKGSWSISFTAGELSAAADFTVQAGDEEVKVRLDPVAK